MANTLKFGNGEWYGKKDTILAYNDENSNYKPLLFDFSRASKATRVNKDGLIEEVGSGQPRVDYLNNTKGAMLLEPSRTNLITQSESFPNSYWTKSGASIQADPSTAGSELITNGGFDTDSDWNKGTGWTISGGKASSDGSQTSGSYLSQGLSGVSQNKQYITEFDIVVTSGSFRFNTLGGNLIVTESGNYTITSISTSGTSLFLEAFSDFVGSIDNVSVKEVQGFTSPDGTNNAYKLVEGTNNGNHLIYSAFVSGSSGNNYTTSFFVKAAERTWCKILNYGGTQVFFDLENGVVGTETNASGKIEALSNDWYKISMTYVSQSSERAYLYIAEDDNDNSYQGDGTSGIYVFGSQVEAGSYSTSLIKTQGTIQTRLADSCNNGGNDQVINSTEGVLYTEINLIYNQSGRYITLGDGTSNNRIIIGAEGGTNRIVFYVIVGGNVQCLIPYILSDINAFYKIAIKYKQNDFALWVNGIEVGTDTSGSTLASNTLSKLVFNGGTGTSNFYGKTKDVRVYNTALTDSELQALTQV